MSTALENPGMTGLGVKMSDGMVWTEGQNVGGVFFNGIEDVPLLRGD